MLVKTRSELMESPDWFNKNLPFVDVVTTYQGEGPNCGKRMTLVRFKYCNKACPFCDTQKMMKNIEEKMYSLKDISVYLNTSNGLMITGGEPTLNSKMVSSNNVGRLSNLDCTLLMLRYLNYNWADIETNGCNLISLLNDISTTGNYDSQKINISWSPKFIVPADYKCNVENAIFAYQAKCLIKPVLKIVISKDDNIYKKFLYEMVNLKVIPTSHIYLMPLGTTYDQINESMEECLKISEELCCNISSRLQILHKFP